MSGDGSGTAAAAIMGTAAAAARGDFCMKTTRVAVFVFVADRKPVATKW